MNYPIRIEIVKRPAWLSALPSVLRTAYTFAVFGGCTYLVFWRGESGWLYVPAVGLIWFRRGL